MSRATFDNLATERLRFEQSSGTKTSNVFVPWAGELLIRRSRGIYYVGISANAEEASGDQTYEARLAVSEDFCRTELKHRLGAPFWHFLNELTLAIFDEGCVESKDLWGWSNLLKIAPANANDWPLPLVEFQRAACLAALREEIFHLRQSLIVIASVNEYGLLEELIPKGMEWNKKSERAYHLLVPETGNLFVQSYHPNYANRKGFLNPTVQEILDVARDVLPRFER